MQPTLHCGAIKLEPYQYLFIYVTIISFTYRHVSKLILSGAYYTTVLQAVGPTVRAVVLNTNLYLTGNRATEEEQDPAGQYAWFENTMGTARTNNEKV